MNEFNECNAVVQRIKRHFESKLPEMIDKEIEKASQICKIMKRNQNSDLDCLE